MRKPDNLIKYDVNDALEWDLLLDTSRIEVAVDDGLVTLTGVVYSYNEYLLAEEDASAVNGISGVDNRLLVGTRGEAIADANIASGCVTALATAKHVPAGSVTVEVSDGWVTLHGRVREHFQRQAAKHAVKTVPGVRGILDDITISGDPIPSDVAARIDKALARSALLQGSCLAVSNVGSTIYLDGRVTSFKAFRTAEEIAWSAPGVTAVVDRTAVLF